MPNSVTRPQDPAPAPAVPGQGPSEVAAAVGKLTYEQIVTRLSEIEEEETTLRALLRVAARGQRNRSRRAAGKEVARG